MILPCRGSEPTLCSGPSLTDSCSYYRPPLAGKLPVNSHRNSYPRVPIFPSGSGLAGFPVLRSRPQASDLLPRCYGSRQPGASRLGRAGVALTALSQAAGSQNGLRQRRPPGRGRRWGKRRGTGLGLLRLLVWGAGGTEVFLGPGAWSVGDCSFAENLYLMGLDETCGDPTHDE